MIHDSKKHCSTSNSETRKMECNSTIDNGGMCESMSTTPDFFMYTIRCVLLVVAYFILQRLSWMVHPMYSDKRSPRLVPYVLPYLGSVKSFYGDMIGFLRKYQKKYDSDIFAAYVGGRPMVFVLDPIAAASVISGRIPQLSWRDTKYRLMRHVMQSSDHGADTWADLDTREAHTLLEKHLIKNENLNNQLLKYQHNLKYGILPSLIEEGGQDWHSIGMMTAVGEAIYRSTAESLYGYKSFSTHFDFEQSVFFDKKLAVFAGIRSAFVQKMIGQKNFDAREEMVEKMREVYRNLENSMQDKLSQVASEVDDFYSDKMSHEDMTRYRYLYFAAAFMNTVPAGFWTFYEMMANKDAFEAVKKEVLSIYERKSQAGYSAPEEEKGEIDSTYSTKEFFTLTELDEMEALDSIITEALRLRSTAKMLRVRYATDDFEIKLPLPFTQKVSQFNVKKGTYFISCPTLMHRDPEIFEDPMTFKWNRFMKDENGKTPVFKKNGKRILRPVDAFGGTSNHSVI